MGRLLAICAALLLGTGCDEKTSGPAPNRDGRLGKQRCTGQPGAKNKRLPVLDRPFDSHYPVFNLFDHLIPGAYRPFDPGSKELTYCGLDMLGLAEGYEGYSWGLPPGTPVLAAADGEVVFAGTEPEFFCPLTKTMVQEQKMVEVKHAALGGHGYLTRYRHLGQVLVKVGDQVVSGDRVGLSGKSGCALEPLLYFGVLRLTGTKTRKPTPVDPYGWDGPAADPWAQDAEGAESLYLWKDGEAPTLRGR